ncbi:MAG: helix-turn-helix domain-containing protein [Phenylobacterium sp.]|jgi:DNA-binding transcriptional regulator YiaG|uniref:helix-turn-helix domain-containing protein n=1 Tax=Phenylobacterium sp. TaxID=1871053 RepID=UPI0011FDAF46|nr:helix-turn-helix domain-containing protein [Phenylobacterium sp.]TAJ73708.1 MAG: helix-turn-helix domain-containing protein [Phenylobacterium sp.]
MSNDTETGYRYTACGLDNVYLVGLPVVEDRAGDETITIPCVNQLHALLRSEVANKSTGLDPKEIRFLRTELGMTQAQLAKLVHKDAQTVGRWERGDTAVDGASETLLRAMTLEALDPEQKHPFSIRDLTVRAVQSLEHHDYRIDASKPGEYRALAA